MNRFVFYGNGIGNGYSTAITKAFLETIQFIPGKDGEEWLKTVRSKVKRVSEWLPICLASQENSEENLLDENINKAEPASLVEIIGGKAFVSAVKDCPELFLAHITMPSTICWNAVQGIPIA